MKINNLVLLLVLIITLVSFENLNAQEYKYEIGGAIGTSFYIGDANRTKPFLNAHPSAGLIHRYNMNLNWALKSNFVVGAVSGDTEYSGNTFPNNNESSFKRTFFDIGGQVEYNLFPYSDEFGYLGTRLYSPYLFTGLGLSMATGESMFFNVNIPIGVGIKYKVRNKLNIGLEFSVRKLFGDNFDVTNNKDEWNLDAPFGIKSSVMKNTDWYSVTMLFITWEFGNKFNPCCSSY